MPFECEWTVPADHPALAGHFPGNPVLPGVVVLDTVTHWAQQVLGQPVAAMASAKFLAPLLPGDQTRLTLTQDARGGVRFAVHLAQRVAVQGQLVLGTGA